jgi:hypothetical protein
MLIVSSSKFDLNKVNRDNHGLLDFLFFKYPNKYYIQYIPQSFPSRMKILEYLVKNGLNNTYIDKAFVKAIIAEKVDILSLLYPYTLKRNILDSHIQLHKNVLWNMRKNYLCFVEGCSKETGQIAHYLFNELVMREILEF